MWEKQYLVNLYEQYKDRYRVEDDYILRYFTYRWFIDRLLSKHEKFKNLDKQKFLNVMVKNPSSYIELYKSLEQQIIDKTINIEEFKNSVVWYLDEDQKRAYNWYKDLVLWVTITWKNITFWEYIQQIEYEFLTISYLNFSWYFNIVMDFIVYAKQHLIAVWPGRWSAAWSLLSYFIYITDADPLKYELLFERMLHVLKKKNDIPDIDVDFESEQREKLIRYVKEKYWDSNVCHVWNYLTTKIKSQFKDMVRSSSLPFEKANYITKTLWTKDEENEKSVEDINLFYQWSDVAIDERVSEILLEYRTLLEPIFWILNEYIWYPKVPWTHACWIIISPVPIEVLSSCRYHKTAAAKIWYFNVKEFESWGLLKFDFLWLTNMWIIKNAIKSILFNEPEVRKKYNIELTWDLEKDWDTLDWYPMYYDILDNIWIWDNDVFEDIFQLWLTTWVFQFESDWMKRILKWIQPNWINELSDMNALYRPWPLQYIRQYKDTKFEWIDFEIFPKELIQKLIEQYWKQKVYDSIDFYDKIWQEVTSETKQIFVYQEQLMKFFNLLWHDYWSADTIRKIYSKLKWWKLTWKDLQVYYDKTISILEEKWVLKELFDYIYTDILLDWASYWFNKSHAMTYSIIAYVTWWLKKKYKEEFFVSLLRIYENDPEKVSLLVSEMNILDVEIKWPNLNSSWKHAIVTYNN